MMEMCTDTFWDWNLTWGNHNEYPQFTKCFQDTVLLWIPSLWLWLIGPLYVYILLQYKDAPVPRSWKYMTKMSLVVVQLSVVYLHLEQTTEVWGLGYIGLLVEGSTLLMAMFYMELERRKGFVTSGILTIYWFLAILCGTVLVYSKRVQKFQNSDVDREMTLSNTYLGLAVLQFALVCLADTSSVSEQQRECKMASSSFISRCFFLWFDSFMSLGYKRPLEAEDISAMMPNDQHEIAVQRFEQVWKKEEEKLSQKYKKTDKKESVSLFKVLVVANWSDLLAANLLHVLGIGIVLSRPLVTGLLVGFAGDPEQPTWKGYVLLLAGVMCIIGNDLVFSYTIHLCHSAALRINQCLKCAVFKKALKLTNKERSEASVGEIVNILGEHVGQVLHFVAYFFWIWSEPVKVIGNLVILYATLDFAALAGLSVLAFVMPLNIFFARQGHNTHIQRRDKKDDRIKLMTEILNGIKILKLYAWEMVFGDKILEIRNEEIRILRKQRLFRVIGSICWSIAPYMMSLVTFSVYVHLSADHRLTAETAFRAWATFGMLTGTFNALPHVVSHFVRSLSAIQKVEKFLNSEEIPDDLVKHDKSDDAITIENGTFTWDEKLGSCLTHIDVSVPRGSLVAVVGSVGSGKSSLLNAILGNMDKDEGTVNVDGSVAYVPQQAWIQNCTLKDNILFGHPYREKTYNDVIEACSLRRDLDILPGRDMTEIGEKGINLSGGQKQRISMARAVYFNADIYLLDDPLSAVDAHVGKEIFDHVISKDGLLRNKTRVLVTHGITWLPRVDKIYVMEDGEITEAGTYEDLMNSKGAFSEFIQRYKQEDHSHDDQEDLIDVVKTTEKSREAEEEADNKLIDELLDSTGRNTPFSCNETTFQRLLSDSGYISESETSSSKSDRRHTHDLAARRRFVRSISRAISIEDRGREEGESIHNLIQIDTFDDKQKMNEERVKRETDKAEKGKLMEEEELETGKVHVKYIMPYFKAIGILPCVVVLIFFLVYKLSEISQNVTLREWTGDSELSNLTTLPADSEEREKRNYFYINIYMLVGVCYCAMSMGYTITIGYSVLKASRILHEKMLKNILRGPMSFFDTTPVGRITNRFSNDIEPLDGPISDHTEQIIHNTFGIIAVFIIIMTSIPKFVVMAIPVFIAYHELEKRFVPVRRQLSRMESKKRSPVYSHFTETLNGVQVLRAFDMQTKFVAQHSSLVEDLCETMFHNRTVDRWMDLRLAFLNSLCYATTTHFAIQGRDYLGGAAVGMMITYILQLNWNLESFVRTSGEIEKDVVCIERIGEYSSTKQEAPLHTEVVPKESWPDNGKVEIVNYSTRYRDGLDLVLKNISVNVRPGEKVGIVGRTGAGKSSLTLALFRLIEPAEGSIHIDEEDISKLGLFDLRNNLTILPQEPVLFSGTLRTNLDPLDAHTDDEVFTALEHAHLKTFVDGLPGKLKYDCGEGGQNLSVGQRQLICLARSLLRKSSVLVLDEATAAVDMKTDELIQNTIKKEFKNCTVLTIAHRLNTIIDYDRILVLDHGEVKEFDSPKTLIDNRQSAFFSMAKDAGLVK